MLRSVFYALFYPVIALVRINRRHRKRQAELMAAGICTMCATNRADEGHHDCIDCYNYMRAAP